MQKLTLSLLVIPAIVGGISLFDQKPAHAWTQFCNKTAETVYVAYARTETLIARGGLGISVADAGNAYKVSGWWRLSPQECKRPNTATGSATRYTQGDRTYSVDHYFYARAVDAYNYWINLSWAGDNILCVINSAFERTQYIGGFTSPENLAAQRRCPANYYQAGFRTINSNTTNWTVNLTY